MCIHPSIHFIYLSIRLPARSPMHSSTYQVDLHFLFLWARLLSIFILGYDISGSQVNSGQEAIQNPHLTITSDRDAFVPSTRLTHLTGLSPTDVSQSLNLTADRLWSNGIYHNYYCPNDRLQSFRNVQDNLSNLPDAKELARMGFFYAGNNSVI